ncbi:hypothetical protein U9M48_006113 [Paspalum notatum var. saurae]|uniref:Uncharacterized protein n=1 Tax=Paspalum notatum var. saurae TaxID=547442 RepID=A0AAQ3PX60_PASNO
MLRQRTQLRPPRTPRFASSLPGVHAPSRNSEACWCISVTPNRNGSMDEPMNISCEIVFNDGRSSEASISRDRCEI